MKYAGSVGILAAITRFVVARLFRGGVFALKWRKPLASEEASYSKF
jgi:hypothetical protein